MIRSRLGRRDDPAGRESARRCSPQCSSCRSSGCRRRRGAATWAFGAWRGRQRRRAEADLVRRGLPEVVDLFVVGIGAGLNVPLALRSIGPRCPAPFADALRSTVTQTEMGMRTADALEALPQRLGEPVRPLSSALIASERYGVPLTASLERLADEVRRDRRRHAETAARRVPVKLLFPLVFCSRPRRSLERCSPHRRRAASPSHLTIGDDINNPSPPCRRSLSRVGARTSGDAGQATAEYALVLLGAAAIALLIGIWATSGGGAGKVGDLLDDVFSSIKKNIS
jgi:hypothetical protein